MADERVGAPRRDELDALTQGYIAIFPSFPTPNGQQRGRFAIKFNSAGIADEVRVCRKKDDDAYEWLDITAHAEITGNPHSTTAADVGALTQTTADGVYVAKTGNANIAGTVTCQGVKLATGTQETGTCGVVSYVTTGAYYGTGVNFRTEMSVVPSSITLTQVARTNFNVPYAENITKYGFHFIGQASASNNTGTLKYTYTTVGN